MVIHLDSAFVIDALREAARQKPGAATRFLEEHGDDRLALSVFVSCELEAGAAGARDPERERARLRGMLPALTMVYPDERFAPAYADLLVRLPRDRTIATMDLLIATIAVVEDAPLVTRNRAHFEGVPGLRLVAY